MNESEAGGDLVLIETSRISHVNDAVLMLISRNLHMKRSEVSIKTRLTPASLSFKGQATKHTTVKWSIFFMITGMAYFADYYFDVENYY